MNKSLSTTIFTKEKMIMLCLSAELMLMIFSGVGFYGLSKAPFHNIGIDPIHIGLYATGIPQTILQYPWLGFCLDICLVLLPIIIGLFSTHRFFNFLFFIIAVIYYCTLTGYLGHRNFQSGFVFIMLPLLFHNISSRFFMKEILRYWVLFFYVSAGCFKLLSPGLLDINNFSDIISHQYTSYFLENHLTWRTTLNLWLQQHQTIGCWLYFFSVMLELSLLVGFITKRFDYILLAMVLFLHFGNWVLMDIAPWGQIAFIISVFIYTKTDDNHSTIERLA